MIPYIKIKNGTRYLVVYQNKSRVPGGIDIDTDELQIINDTPKYIITKTSRKVRPLSKRDKETKTLHWNLNLMYLEGSNRYDLNIWRISIDPENLGDENSGDA